MTFRRRLAAIAALCVVASLVPATGSESTVSAGSHDEPDLERVDENSLDDLLDPGAAQALLDETNGEARIVVREDSGITTFVGGTEDEPLAPESDAEPAQTARDFIDANAGIVGVERPESELRQGDISLAADSGTAVRFDQHYDGLPVLAGEVVVHLAPDGSVLTVAGETSPSLDLDTVPTVSSAQAEATAVALAARNDDVDAVGLEATGPELTVYDPALIGADGPQRPRLVWRVDVRTELGDVDRLVLVDATTGSIALTFDQRHDLDRIVCDNLNSSTTLPCTSDSAVRLEGEPVTGLADVDAAYENSGATYDFFFDRVGRDSIDGSGMQIVSTVRYGTNYQNAFWNGTQMVYGVGFAIADDVVGHELTHGITEHESGLLYYAQAGAINESMSDVFGEFIDLTHDEGDDPADRWLVAEDLPGGAIRNMADPTLAGDPDRMTSSSFVSGPTDGQGVHSNSGVGNKTAFLITDGGTFNGVTVAGIGLEKAARIYYRTETDLLTSGSDYADLGIALPQACRSLIPGGVTTESDCLEVDRAVLATELLTPPTAGGAHLTAPVCDEGEPRYTLAHDDMETLPGLAWQTAATPPSSASQWKYRSGNSSSGVTSLWGPTPGSAVAARRDTLVRPTAAVTVPPGQVFLRFEHSYNFDYEFSGGWKYYDGGVVELSVDSAAPIDAGGHIVDNSYTGTVVASPPATASPLGGRQAFVGPSPGYVETRVDLSAFAAQTVRPSWRIGTDSVVGFDGWFVDDVQIYVCGGPASGSPDAPTSVTATPDEDQFVVQWSAPTNPGDSPIEGYVITPYVDGQRLTSVVTESPDTSATIPGLDPSIAHTFLVAAWNSTGIGADSATTPPPDIVPGAPISVVATSAGAGQVVLQWSAPAPNGGSAILDYLVTPFVGGVPQVPIATPTPATTMTVSGLPLAVAHTFTVAARNAAGTGPASAPSGAVVPRGSGFTAVGPVRVFDTRPGESPNALRDVTRRKIAGNDILEVKVTDLIGPSLKTFVPAGGVAAVSLNVSVTNPQGPGFLTVYTCGERTLVASLTFTTGQTISNAVTTPISPNGTICFYSNVAVDIITDLNGWIAQSAGFTAVGPVRVFDTRPGESPNALRDVTRRKIAGNDILEVKVTDLAGHVPANGVAAVSLNVSVTNPQGPGFLTVYTCGERTLVASLTFTTGQTISNAVTTPISPNGTICFYSNVAVDIITDLNGWIAQSTGFTAVGPVRVFDTRPGESPNALRDVTRRKIAGNDILEVKVTDLAGHVPANGVAAVSLNVSVTNPQGPGFLTVYTCGERTLVASLTFTTGQTISNAVTTPISPNGTICFYSNVAVDIITDLNGWWAL